MVFYSTVPLNSTKYFTGLFENAATLFSTKVADIMLEHSRQTSIIPAKGLSLVIKKWRTCNMLEDMCFTNYTTNTDNQNCVNQQHDGTLVLF